MAAVAHLTLVAPDNEKFTVQSAPARLGRRKASLQAQVTINPNYDWQAPKPFHAGKRGRIRRKRLAHSPGGGAGGRGGRGGGGGLGLGLGV